jgi:RNA polymerase sigma-70 factor, ECF subfamily
MIGKDGIALTPAGIDPGFSAIAERPNWEPLSMPSKRGTPIRKNRHDLNDGELIERCRAGDTAAFGELVTRYRNKACVVVCAMVQNEQDALDLAQEGFLNAWRSIDRFKGRSSFYTWLYRIMRNVTVDSLRRKRMYTDAEFDDRAAVNVEPGSQTTPSGAPLPAKELQRKEIQQRVNEAIAQLSPSHRAVFVMKEFENLQYHEIAEILECSIGTVMSRLYYARKRLQILLKDLYETL